MQSTKIANAIEKFNKHQEEKRENRLQERQKYLTFCNTEAAKIVEDIIDDILDDIELEGDAYLDATEKYDNIFQPRIGGIIADTLRDNGLMLSLFPASRVIKVSVDSFGQSNKME